METLNYELIRILVALLGCGAAAYQDYKTSFIDEKIIYIMIAIGLLMNLFPFLIEDNYLIVYALIVSIIILTFGYLFYKKGQLGMGDVLLFVGIQQLLPLAPSSLKLVPAVDVSLIINSIPPENWFLVGYLNIFNHMLFFITIFLVSSFIATLGASLQYAIALLKSTKALKPNKFLGPIALVLALIGSVFLYYQFGVSAASFLFFLLLISSAFFVTFREQILDEIIIRRIPISEIEDEDIFAIDKMPAELVKKYNLQRVLTIAEVKKLQEIEKNEKMHLFPVNKVLPRFGPYILIALLLGILYGNIVDMIAFLR
ncbi:prepilin peptidase [Candidatus Micrarchaeota archaeon]|nr:prepilin peptidase [Candidatus Micrarchaeota archaeon]